jgi:hypothetical protein
MHHDFEPYDLLIGTHNRVNGLEEALKEINRLLTEVAELSQTQARIVQRQSQEIVQLRNNEQVLSEAIGHLLLRNK